MIAQIVAPPLAGTTPGTVHGRHKLSGIRANRVELASNVSGLRSHA